MSFIVMIGTALEQIIKATKKGLPTESAVPKIVVPEAGIEPARPEEQGILSLKNRSILTVDYQEYSNNIRQMTAHDFS
ncbi:hypothetical protein [Solidesulfovibrio magneticus]|uniref:Uncharacterized protein n=1 Tax=Solidesulfovibrio magneticus (strain ATCC 700980 / DSM 13731 / RS-1) TaxID=573370 RepID=C4XJ51_SOLM1|nr:hypothetical protein [Solidesulfovibrio magneticus]BAH74215.1 hypothetical protein DMR_07240 [Solidesulfovibrio magneticus RS-1]